jgi:beta-glucosidase
MQLYLVFPKSDGAPLRALRAFERVHVAAGAKQHVTFHLQPRDLSYVNERGDHIVGAGTYRIRVGGGQPGTAASGAEVPLTIRGEQKLPD